MSEEVIPKGQRLIETWIRASVEVESQRRRLSKDMDNERACHDELAKWLMPSDAKPGEKIAVWHGDSLIQVEVGGVAEEAADSVSAVSATRVTIRTRGKS